MPGANFCQGCGRPLSASVEFGKSTQLAPAEPPRQYVCFRCSQPLAADAKVCEKCGLNVENLINVPAQPQLSTGRVADVAEVMFFSPPSPPDPQLAAFKSYASWFGIILFAVAASFAAYSWLEASNVIGRLIGENAAHTQVKTLGPLGAVTPQHKSSVPSFASMDAKQDAGNTALPDVDSASATAPAETLVAESIEADKVLRDNKAPKYAAKAKVAKPSGSTNDGKAPAAANDVLPALPVAKPEAAEQQLPIRNRGQTFSPETISAQPETESPPAVSTTAPVVHARPKRRVIVTQIEPNENPKGGAKVASPVEDFFRRWKKSIKQGVSDRPCTQQERALNQCYD